VQMRDFIKDDTKITSRINKSNESETCGLGLELDLSLRPVDLTISESEDLDLPLWDSMGLDYISHPY